MLDKEFAGFAHKPSVNIDNQIWNLVISIDVTPYKDAYMKKAPEDMKQKVEQKRKELAEFAAKTADLFSRFRSKFYASVIDKMLVEIKGGKIPNKMIVNLNEKNKLHMLPQKDRVILLYGIHFEQYTDISLVRVLLQEMEDTKRHVRNCIDATHYEENSQIPDYIISEDKPKNYSNGLVVFNLFANKYENIKKKLHFFVFFKEYIQFHVHSIKTFLHIRMSKKAQFLQDKLNACKIIPDDYYRKIRDINFFINKEKKENQKAIFDSEVKKVNAK